MQAVETALEAALIVMQNGGSTVAASRTFANILRGYRKEGVSTAGTLPIALGLGTGMAIVRFVKREEGVDVSGALR